jgi:predicted dehydrogenase
VLVNQAPHQLDLLAWFLGEIEEISGRWANINHPTVEVEDTAVVVVRFRSGALGSIVASLSQRPGLFTHVHVHGSNGASVGVETDRGASFVAGVSSIVEPPRNDLWNVPGEEGLLDEYRRLDRERFAQVDATTHYHELQIGDFLRAILEDRAPAVTGEDGRTVVAMFTAIYRSQRDGGPVRFPVVA